MAIADVLDIKTTFRLDLSTEKFYFEDITPYLAESISFSDIQGSFKVIDPTGAVIYDNPDIIDVSDLRTAAITGVNQGSKTFTIEYDRDFKLAVDTPFEVFDSTGNNGFYTLVSFTVVAGESVITVAETIPDATVDGEMYYKIFPPVEVPKDAAGNLLVGIYSITYTILNSGGAQDGTYSVTKTFDFCYEEPTINISQAVSCSSSSLTSNDLTDYSSGTNTINETVTRVHTIVPPAGSGLSNTVGSTVTLVASPISTKTWATTIVTTVLLEYVNQFFIQDELSGSKEIVVNCEESLCDAYCCIALLESDYRAALTTNLSLADTLYEKLLEISIYMTLFTTALSCGRTEDATAFLNRILAIGNCQPGCSCDSPDPILIVAIGGATGAISVVEGGVKITVTSNTVGDTTTYIVNVDATTSAKIDLLRNTTVTAGTGINVVEDPPLLDGTVNYTVSSTVSDTAFPALVHRLEIITPNVRGTGTTPLYTGSTGATAITGLFYAEGGLKVPDDVEFETTASADGSQNFGAIGSVNNNNNIYIRYKGFLTNPATGFLYDVSVSVRGRYDSIIQTPIEAVGHFQEDDTFVFKLIDTRTGNLMQWSDLLQILDPAQTIIFTVNVYVAIL